MSNGFLNNENNAADTMITINARIYPRLNTYVLRNVVVVIVLMFDLQLLMKSGTCGRSVGFCGTSISSTNNTDRHDI